MTRKNGRCLDCEAEYDRRGEVPKYWRPAPKPGPRCASHDLQKRRTGKKDAHGKRVQRVYGLQDGQYEELYVFQGQRCAICLRATGASRMLSVDHDHKTGLVRGLACRPCNDLLGHIRDDPATAMRIVEYLNAPPAHRMGVVALHEDFRKEEG